MNKIGYMTPPRGSQDASRTPQDGFCLRFGRQLGAILGTFFRPRRPRRPPRRPGLPRGNGRQMAGKTISVPSQHEASFEWISGPIFEGFWSRLRLILEGFWGVSRGSERPRRLQMPVFRIFSYAFSRRLQSPTR